ncbi:DUF1385 domain-containing protein [Christensenellaceae bacterium OttesenSCG-928-M15]|nr:DUF1385 domain-containing protein [Christensenellaceae bacterium OttesenSCG-928-M15]
MKKKDTAARICSVGGQAVMEGVMMKSPTVIAMAVRTGDGQIVTDVQPYVSKSKKGTLLGLPVIRGVVSFVESLTVGMKCITKSAELYGEEIEEEPGRFEKWLSKVTGKSIDKIVIGVAVVLAIILAVGLFFMLPTFISGLLTKGMESTSVVKALIEGVVRLCIFLGYLFAIRMMKDAKRLFMYHGAEHKVIACYEHEAPLTPESAKQFTRFHPRCGTNYMFLVMAVSILFFALVGFNANFWLRLLSRLIFLPIVAGLSYEVLRFGAKENVFSRIVRKPGLALQRLTTIEPDEEMLEVAIAAFELAMNPPEKKEDKSEEAETKADARDVAEAETDTGLAAEKDGASDQAAAPADKEQAVEAL